MSSGNSPSVSWTDSDSEALVNFLLDRKTLYGDCDNGFKNRHWAYAKEAMQTRGMKNIKASSCTSHFNQLKAHYEAVRSIKSTFGSSWSEKEGANVVPNDAWEKFVKTHPNAEPFRSAGFPLFDLMTEVVKPCLAEGKHVIYLGLKRSPVEAEQAGDSDIVEDSDDLDTPVSLQNRSIKSEKCLSSLFPREAKKRRLSEPQQAMFRIADAIAMLAAAIEPRRQESPKPSPSSIFELPALQRRTAAVSCLAQIDGNLSVSTRTAVLRLFQADIAAVDTYMAIADEENVEVRRFWMREALAVLYPGRIFKDLPDGFE